MGTRARAFKLPDMHKQYGALARRACTWFPRPPPLGSPQSTPLSPPPHKLFHCVSGGQWDAWRPPAHHPSSYCAMGLWENDLDFTLSAILSPFFSPPPLFLKLAWLFCSSDRIWFWVSTKGQCAIVLEGFRSLRLHPTHTQA